MLKITKTQFYSGLLIKCSLVEKLTNEDLEIFFNILQKIFDNKLKYFLILDFSHNVSISLPHLMKFGKYMKKQKPNNKKYLFSSAVLIKGNFMKNIIKTAFSIVKPVKPYIISEDINEIYTFFYNNIN